MLRLSNREPYRPAGENGAMIETLLDACQFVLEVQGEP
jgi:hypothetical protein